VHRRRDALQVGLARARHKKEAAVVSIDRRLSFLRSPIVR
jgi:hypothetical protein